ncbi:MAG: PQQ-like beta-propeller repeat protein [Verrucomicrobiales bacterium]|nr:PQQ-like beta-propeller repeat protein [Verrucomicrobiales bacterium]
MAIPDFMATTSPTPDPSTVPRELRLWPGILGAAGVITFKLGLPLFRPDSHGAAILGGFAFGILIILWWLFFSRAPWRERLGGLALIATAVYASYHLVHESIATGMMGWMLVVHGLPIFCLGWVAWAVLFRHWTGLRRAASMIILPGLVAGVMALIRTDGIDGDGGSELKWRWSPTHEERLLGGPPRVSVPEREGKAAHPPTPPTSESTNAIPAADPTPRPVLWSGFRGPKRDGVVRGTRLETNWNQFPPVQLWRRPVGPAWSSFAVAGDDFFTQEQRGEEEWVTCCSIRTGQERWHHADHARFWESNAGAGPRATPTLANGRLYALGGTGILNALNATNGTVLWTRNVAAETQTKTPLWGFSGSPLVTGDLVVVAASGVLAAYDATSGASRWTSTNQGGSYSSPHFAELHGIPQVLFQTGKGVFSAVPSSGEILWEHSWAGATIIQPALLPDGDLLIATGSASGGVGLRRLAVAHSTDGWVVREEWTSKGLKPYFNDFAVHKSHVYGFDGSILACIQLEDGERQWKDGRYGHGQLLLLPDQDLMLVVAEQGHVALVAAKPDGFEELARHPAISGKTWNHPALAGNVLLVRNSEEMAAYELRPKQP